MSDAPAEVTGFLADLLATEARLAQDLAATREEAQLGLAKAAAEAEQARQRCDRELSAKRATLRARFEQKAHAEILELERKAERFDSVTNDQIAELAEDALLAVIVGQAPGRGQT